MTGFLQWLSQHNSRSLSHSLSLFLSLSLLLSFPLWWYFLELMYLTWPQNVNKIYKFFSLYSVYCFTELQNILHLIGNSTGIFSPVNIYVCLIFSSSNLHFLFILILLQLTTQMLLLSTQNFANSVSIFSWRGWV